MKLLSTVLALAMLSTSAQAAQVMLSEQSVVGSTGALSYSGYSYEAGNIFDNQTGAVPIEKLGDGSHWLNPDRPGESWITIDLGAATGNLQFDLFNSHNGDHQNRGTGDFEIMGSNELVSVGANGFTLGGTITRLAGGVLNPVDVANPYISAQRFAAGDGGAYRYIQFRALSSIPKSFTPYAYGLNEMRVFSDIPSAVPEPATWAMMIVGFGLAGAAMRSRPRIDFAI